MAENPEHPRGESQDGYSGVLTGRARGHLVGFRTCVEHFERAFDRLAGLGASPHKQENHRSPAGCIDQGWPIAARLRDIQQRPNGFESLRQLASNNACCRQPEHHLKVLGRLTEPLAQLTRSGEGGHGLAIGRPLGGDEARAQDHLKIEFAAVLAIAGRHAAPHLDASTQVGNGLDIGRAQGCVLTRLQPISDRLFEQSGFREVVRKRFGLRFHDFRKLLLKRVRDGRVQMPASADQEAGISGVAHQCVLEGVDRVRNLATPKNQSGIRRAE